MERNSISNLSSSQLSNSKRYELTSLAVGWFIASFTCFIDYSVNCHIFRFLTACYIPLSVCYVADIGIMIFGIFNVLSCLVALFNFSSIANFFSSQRVFRTVEEPQEQEPDPIYHIFNDILEESLMNRSSNNTSLTSEDYFLPSKYRGPEILRRSSSSLIHNIYTIDQLEDLSEIQDANFAHKTFEPKIKRFSHSNYYATAGEEEAEEENHLSILDQSQIDILHASFHYETHPEEHPLKNSHYKGGYNPAIIQERKSLFGKRLPTYNVHGHPKKALLSRSPKYFKNQKPIVTSITKLFRDKWHVDGEHLTIMMEDIRRFISQQIIQPLAEEICSINQFFLSNNPTRNVSIGRTSIADIEKAFVQIQDEKIMRDVARLPYVLAYLRLNQNYTYFVKRILTWAQSDSIFDYFSDETVQHVTEWPKPSLRSKTSRAAAALPTDSELIFSLFCHFMDTYCGLYPITYPYPCDCPFTRLHILTEDQTPSDLHLGDNGYYLEVSDSKPISFKFHSSQYPPIVSHPTSNVLIAILMLLVYGHGDQWYEILNQRVARLS